MNNLFSLLVGIDEYHPDSIHQPPKLSGCIYDIIAWVQLIKKIYPHSPDENRIALINEEATYENIIHHFGEQHLLKAEKGDFVLFVFSGHGSRELAPKEFKPYFPEGLLETLVCYDSRVPGHFDLADKELSILISRIAEKEAHVIILLDCCHSGSGTKDIKEGQLGKARIVSQTKQPRNLESFLHGELSKHIEDDAQFMLPNIKHILLAACDRKEFAREVKDNRGLFSLHIVNILEETKGKISYATLFSEVRLRMLREGMKQSPQFEPHGLFNVFNEFLGMRDSDKGLSAKVSFYQNQWRIDRGAIHGLPLNSSSDIVFQITIPNSIIHAKVIDVGLETSSIQLVVSNVPYKADKHKTYEARLITLPSKPRIFRLIADEEQSLKTFELLNEFKPINFTLVHKEIHAKYTLVVNRNYIQIIRNIDQKILRTVRGEDWHSMFMDVFEKLEKIAIWEKRVHWNNKPTKLNYDDIDMILYELDEKGNETKEITEKEVSYFFSNEEKGENKKIPIKIVIRNNHPSKTLYCLLFYADSNFRLLSLAFNEEIPSNSKVIAYEDTFELYGETEDTDIFKLFVSEQKVNNLPSLSLAGFILGEDKSYFKHKGQYERKKELEKVRSLIFKESVIQNESNDWFTKNLEVKLIVK